MSGDSYFRHKVVMEVGTKPRGDAKKRMDTFKDDHELLAYLLEQEKLDEQALELSQKTKTNG